MKLLACVYIVATLFVAESLQDTPFLECKKGPSPLSLRVKGCTELPCNLVRGETAVAEWDFEITSDTEMLKSLVKATTMGVTVEYPLPEKNACKSLVNAECPLDEGEEVTYRLTMPVAKFYPQVALTLEISLIDDHGEPQMCFVLPATVV